MSLKSFACTVAACCLLAAPALAQPTLDLGLASSGGQITLDANGDWQWELIADPDDATWAIPGDVGNSLAIEAGLTADGFVSTTLGADFDTANPGTIIFGTETETGTPPFPEGLQDDNSNGDMDNNVFFAYGSAPLGADTAVTALTITTEGPTTATAGGLTTTIELLGTGGTNGLSGTVSQNDGVEGNTDSFGYSGTISYTAVAGDANLDGVTDFDDFLAVTGNFNTAGNWTTGNFDGSALTDFDDFLTVTGNFGDTAPGFSGGIGASLVLGGGGAVPEPGSIVLLGSVLAGAIALRFRK